jgi:tetratricopeptide (TPR) repeat protein
VPVVQPYLDIIDQYRRGDVAAAVDKLRSHTGRDVTAWARALMDRRTAAGQIADRPVVFAAVMLHTEAAFAAVEARRDSWAVFHLRTARDLLDWATLQTPDECQQLIGRRDWHLMVVRVLNSCYGWSVVQSLGRAPSRAAADKGFARAYPGVESDAEMELALGSIAEGFALMRTREMSSGDGTTASLVRQCRQNAEEHFRRALAPGMVEARVRLGQVFLTQNRTAEGEVELRAVLGQTNDARLIYLVLLFLGQVAEEHQRLEEAIGFYQKAVELKPDSQAARVAFAYASERAGRLDTARAAIAPFLARREPRAVPEDDWLNYPRGQFQRGFDALEKMRATVARR